MRKQKKMTKKELVQFLFDNFYDEKEGEITLNDLDFTQFNCNVDISGMRVNGELYQGWQKAKKVLQCLSEAEEILIDNLEKFKVTHDGPCLILKPKGGDK